MQRSERRIEVANGVQADVEAVGDISYAGISRNFELTNKGEFGCP
jgi:hypothetical protein